MSSPKYTLRRGKQRRQYVSPRSSEEEQTTSNRTVAGSTPAGDAVKHLIVRIDWEESERGWGIRPDGASFHSNVEDSKEFIKEYWAGMPKEAPDEYSRPANRETPFEVDDEVYQRIKRTKNGLRIWQHELRNLKK